ncbi:MAG: succinate dehydrogenase assembly factor 2 [Proteobacteria bacterium]|nr:succinate dehydrogenase assembly factor 2 [Pseudomonadota bacterium]
MNAAHADDMARLRWRCRRGLLELDLVFNRFVVNRYSTLDATMQQLFWGLLEEADNSILAWLNGTESCTDSDLNHIIKIIREDIDYKDKKIENS